MVESNSSVVNAKATFVPGTEPARVWSINDSIH